MPSPSSVPAGAVPSVSRILAQGLALPWGLAFLPDGSALVTERNTALIKRITASGQVSTLGKVPGVAPVPAGEGGLLGLAVSPAFGTDATVFVYFTAAADNRIAKLTVRDGTLGVPEPILTGIPRGRIHNGGRLAFGPDGMLYAGTGETSDRPLAQNTTSLGGKILRMTPAGRPAPGNPFTGSVVYSYGHRNVQGMAFARDGRLWASEFGQSTWDELNVIRAGANYGWPTQEGKGSGGRFADPVAQWRVADASPSGIAIAGDAVYMAALRGERLWRIPVSGTTAGPPRAYFTGTYGRLRTVALAPDGSLWLVTSNTGRNTLHPGDDKVLRLTLS
ncbi:MAG: hypothetical protein QOI35_3473 [Cryptosporangiaceae bacterium]|nr:hypothetical protein [Cryptosporangiaceae bacterium]